ncbi:hypothetical protein F4859DRAFT_105961 [Xylaria cf. heliscus]|nr:hypothetical protein F4859DRAFT_105961 [Xylaria cf. heliscus]
MSAHRHRHFSISSAGSQYSGGSSVFSYGSTASTTTLASVSATPTAQFAGGILPCEFVGYGGCDHTFQLDDVESWIEHIISVHLEDKLPSKVVCWFCDNWIFDYENVGDRRQNFENRMWHIRDHILYEGTTAHDMRPDHFFNEHLYKHRLISEYVYNLVRRYTEVPQGNWILPHNALPPDLENKNSRGEREYHNPIEEERKHRKHRHNKPGKSRK